MGKVRNSYHIIGGKQEGKKLLGRPRVERRIIL
jgi:hypothetical protein